MAESRGSCNVVLEAVEEKKPEAGKRALTWEGVEEKEPADGEKRISSGSVTPSTRSRTQLQLEMEDWSTTRLQVHVIVNSHKFDVLMGGVIFLNVVLMLVEADQRAKTHPVEPEDPAVIWLNRLLLIVYTVEASARAYTDRSRYLQNRWNCLDCFIVAIGWVDELLAMVKASAGELSMLRILRVARLIRVARLLRFFPELYVMIRGFFGAMKAMFWGLSLIIFLLLIWSLFCVEIIHPINYEMVQKMRETDPDSVNEYCAEAFSSVFKTMILYFQTLVAGDSWGLCTLPIIEFEPWTFLIFAISLVSVSLGFMNLILAVIVDNATAAREGDREEMMKEKKKEEAAALKKWKEVIKQIDADGSGTITMQELMDGYEVPEVRETLEIMGIDKEDLEVMFNLMDEDGSGDLDYDEFIDAFLKAQGQDLRIYLMMTKLQMDSVARTAKRITKELEVIEEDVSGAKFKRPSQRASYSNKAALGGQQLPPTPVLPSGLEAAALEADFQRMNAQIQAQFKALAYSIEQNTATVAAAAQAAPSKATQPKGEAQVSDPNLEPSLEKQQAGQDASPAASGGSGRLSGSRGEIFGQPASFECPDAAALVRVHV